MIAIDDQGDFLDVGGSLTTSTNEPKQCFIAEVRCLQTTYLPDETYGRNYLVWNLGGTKDRQNDLIRISKKYLTINSVTYKNGVYQII